MVALATSSQLALHNSVDPFTKSIAPGVIWCHEELLHRNELTHLLHQVRCKLSTSVTQYVLWEPCSGEDFQQCFRNSVSILGSAIASGYLVASTTMVKMHRLPLSDTGAQQYNKSTATLRKGSFINGMVPNGILETLPLGMVLWQMSQDLQNLRTSLVIPDQWKLLVILSVVVFAPR